MNQPSVTIIGLGKVGTAFLNVLPEKGYKIASVFTRTVSDSKEDTYGEELKKGLPGPRDELGEIVMLTVPDAAIESVSQKIAGNMKDLYGRIFIHCSGTLSASALKAVQKKGALTGSFHPMMSVTNSTASFEGIWFDIEGDEKAIALLQRLAEDIGARSFQIDSESKIFLHASAVVASNYLVALAEIATRMAETGGISKEKALQFLLPLMQSTLANLGEHGIEKALTGPIARTDTHIIGKHLDILKKDVKLAEIYKQLGLFTAEVAERISVDDGALEEIKKLLS